MDSIQQPVVDDAALVEKLKTGYREILTELRKVIIAQDAVVEQVMISLMVGAHSMITGVPGLAKTLLIKTLSRVLDLSFKRIQFTPDLLPSDILGLSVRQHPDRDAGIAPATGLQNGGSSRGKISRTLWWHHRPVLP